MNNCTSPTRILFVCLGNICRSPTAQGVMENILKKTTGLNHIEIDSAGILNVHQGELPDKRMRTHASKRGYNLTHLSRQVRVEDFDDFDLILGMDDKNISNLIELAPTIEDEQKIRRMTDYAIETTMDHVPDPYYGGSKGFELVLDIIEDCCKGLVKTLDKRI